MERREFLAAAAGSLATAATTGLFTTKAFASDSEIDSELLIRDPKVLAQLKVVTGTAFACVAAAHACVQHCQEQLIAGNGKEFANCSIASHQMLPVCEAIGTLSALKAKSIADFLDGCIKACETCRAACAEHEAHFAHGMHAECKACMLACIACRDACKALKAML